jgi:CRP-like cAMP-binding protein
MTDIQPAGLHPSQVASSAALTSQLSGNALLAGLPVSELDALRGIAERVRPRMRETLYTPGEPIDYVYFPQSSVMSLLAEMADGTIIETLTVGNEGMIGLSAILGARHSPTRAICQISGWTIRMPAAAFIDAVPRSGELFDRLMRYSHARLRTLSQSVACNRLHSAQQRYARWVLTTHDRIGLDEFPITQEFLSQMLGLTRPTISLVGQALQREGFIHLAQGRLTVDDRSGLERVACECYAATRKAFKDFLEPRSQ